MFDCIGVIKSFTRSDDSVGKKEIGMEWKTSQGIIEKGRLAS
jgi:hypothetical protein